jgi:hypothetical protein
MRLFRLAVGRILPRLNSLDRILPTVSLHKLIINIASCWFILYGYITMRGQQNAKFDVIFGDVDQEKLDYKCQTEVEI